MILELESLTEFPVPAPSREAEQPQSEYPTLVSVIHLRIIIGFNRLSFFSYLFAYLFNIIVSLSWSLIVNLLIPFA